jgi:hypothetical protein
LEKIIENVVRQMDYYHEKSGDLAVKKYEPRITRIKTDKK